MKSTKSIPFLLVPLLLASSAMSQLADWENVKVLPGGTKIKVTLRHGHAFGHCFFDGATDDALACTSRAGFYSRRIVNPRDNVKAVYRAHNGPAIGLGIGAGAGAVMGAATHGTDRGFFALIDAGILGGVGYFFGMVLDPFFHGKAVYRGTNSSGQQSGPRHPGKDSSSPSPAEEEDASQPVSIPCLRDGVTLQCVP